MFAMQLAKVSALLCLSANLSTWKNQFVVVGFRLIKFFDTFFFWLKMAENSRDICKVYIYGNDFPFAR
jgi:hypothetical protein